MTLLLILAVLITAAVFSANAETETPDQILATANAMDFSDPNNLPDYCPACGTKSGVTWTAVPQNTKDNRIGYGKSGHYYIPSGGVTLASNINNFATAAANSTLCIHLNGQPVQYGSRIAPNNATAVINIMGGNGGSITLVPFTGTAEHAQSNRNNIAALDVQSGKLNVYGGTYTTTDSTRQVLRVCGGTATLYGATVDGNAIAQSIYVTSGTLSMNNTTVQNGTATYGGNIRIDNGTHSFSGGAILGGVSSYGGNIYLSNSSLSVTGTSIADGDAGVMGGNVYVSASSFTVNSGSITGGETTDTTNGLGGGNICSVSNSSVTIKGTEETTLISGGIAGGKSNAGGGNVRAAGGSFIVEGGKLSGGSANYCGGSIYITGGTSFQLKGGKVEGGTTPNKAGGTIYLYNGDLSISEGAVIDKADGTGSNMLYIESANATMESAGDLLNGITFVAANAAKASFTGGKVYALSATGTNCTITGGQFRSKYTTHLAEGHIFTDTFETPYAYAVYPEGILGVDSTGKKTAITTDPMTAWNTGNYAYLRLIMDTELSDLGGKAVCIDLAGKNLTVGGSGTLDAFDSANDTYNAANCGRITNNGTVAITPDVAAPNGNHYIALTDGTTSMHRLNARITSVTLRPSAAGLYYKATYDCDTLLSAKVMRYGVILSVDDMPGKDFLTDTDSINLYTALSSNFESGVTATSGSVFGIMKAGRTAAENAACGEIEIYANPYLLLNVNGGQYVVGDTNNSGKTSAEDGFTGTAWSLREVLTALDQNYSTYPAATQAQLDSFYYDWDNNGMGSWDFANIGGGVDNSNLSVGDGNNTAYCPVCKKDVQWTALTDDSAVQVLQGHYYLTDSLNFTGTSSAGYIYNDKANTSLCLHLNGHNITATKTRVIFGSSGRVNVMGNGEVAGYNGGGGSTVQLNNSSANNGVYLYGGTWKKGANAASGAAVLGVHTVGGTIHVYKGAAIEASGSLAIQTAVPTNKDASVVLNGCTVNGDVLLNGADSIYGFKTHLEMVNCKLDGSISATGDGCSITVEGGSVTGTLDADGISGITLRSDARIALLDLEETLVTMDALTSGADFTVANTGIFTQPHANAASFAQYFHPQKAGDVIDVENDSLRCRTDYTSKLNPDGEGKALCPVCREKVLWTPVTNSDHLVLEKGGHYYLTTDILYEAAYDSNGAVSYLYGGTWRDGSACFHLNGHSITATKAHAIYGGYGQLNVMGEGVVSGYRTGSVQNAAVQINNTVSGGAVNLYSGTYQKSADSGEETGVVGIQSVGGTLRVYGDAEIRSFGTGAMYIGSSKYTNSTVELYGVTIPGDIVIAAPTGSYCAKVTGEDITVTGEMNVGLGNQVSLNGQIKIGKLTLPAGQAVTIGDLAEGSAITVSADGYFTNTTEKADLWLNYFTCADAGDWIIEKDKQLYQGAKQSLTGANADDVAALNAAYSGKTVKYGEMHNHTNTGPKKGYNTGADGQSSLAEWMAEMQRLNLDFATIVDHGQSIHMYDDDWNETFFIGGTEPATTISDSKAVRRTPHYNMLFSDPAALESIMFKWADKYVPITEDGYTGYRLKYASFTTAQFTQLAKDVYEAGGLLVHVHPKYNSYIVSDDPMDYYFADNTGLEISTGDGGNMVSKDNEEAYQLWVDLLQLGKKIWATAGSDKHHLPDTSALTTMYTDDAHCDIYLDHIRAGNFAPGWIGIRMNIGGTAMGGNADFSGQRLQFSVGDIYTCENVDTEGTAPVYVEGHTYRVELYDDSGLLMESVIDPTEMNYFAIDCDETAMFYRIVVWDDTAGTRIGVSNPIWNTNA